MTEHKKCGKCQQVKLLTAFYRDKSKKLGVTSYCKNCRLGYRRKQYGENKPRDRDYFKEYYRKNPHKAKEYSLKMYGLTLDDFNSMRDRQKHCCAICQTHESDLRRKLFVDHCHATGKVRGLLCQSCNTMIGNAKDSVLVLQAGIKYLSKA